MDKFEKMNEDDYKEFKKYRITLEEVLKKFVHVDLAMAFGLGSRESNWGRTLQNGWGDRGNAYGIFQVDKRFHQQHINSGHCSNFKLHSEYALNLLENNISYFYKKYPNDGDANLIRGICAYNAGCRGVEQKALKNGYSPDVATTGKNYGTDVLNRMKWFKNKEDDKNG